MDQLLHLCKFIKSKRNPWFLHISPALGQTKFEVITMEKDKKNEQTPKKQQESDKKPETFQDHWQTGTFLGPNTLRYEENRRVYEEEDSKKNDF